MLSLRHIYSLTDFLRNHKEHLARMQRENVAEVLTINGRPEVVIQTSEGYQSLLDRLDYAESVAGIKAAYAQHKAGEARDYDIAVAELRKEYDL